MHNVEAGCSQAGEGHRHWQQSPQEVAREELAREDLPPGKHIIQPHGNGLGESSGNAPRNHQGKAGRQKNGPEAAIDGSQRRKRQKAQGKAQSGTQQKTRENGQPTEDLGPYLSQEQLDATLKTLRKLAEKAASGDSLAMDTLRAKLDELPYVWEMLGDLNRDLEDAIAQAVAPDDLLKQESMKKRASRLRGEMCHDDSSMATKLAAGRVVSCWQLLQLMEKKLATAPDVHGMPKRLAAMYQAFATAMRTYVMARKYDVFIRQTETVVTGGGTGGFRYGN